MPRHLIAPLRAVYAAWMANTSGKTVPAATMPIEVAHAKSRKAEQIAGKRCQSLKCAVGKTTTHTCTQIHVHIQLDSEMDR
jgi:hypothetical protein